MVRNDITKMKIYAPNYYKEFKCIADKCRHTCCAGWEIDIDEDSLKRYEQMDGPMGAELRANISYEGDPHFILKEGERCPFLRRDGLCRLILTEGEDVLCQICRDHPRFRNYWSDRVELGLGMACEEAARLILSSKTPLQPEVIDTDEEPESPLTEDEEYLMEIRQDMMSAVQAAGPGARLWEYLVYRHLPDAQYDGRLEERIAFVQKAYADIMEQWESQQNTNDLDSLVEICRDFSDRIEYDTDMLDIYR